MRKIFFITAAVFLALTSTALAARSHSVIGVVVVGSEEFSSDAYCQIVANQLKPKSGARIFSGKKIQLQYKTVWANFGGVGTEDNPQREDMIQFAAFSGCTKVLFFVASNSGGAMTVDAYLCTPSAVETTFTSSRDEDTSDKGARRGAFRRCVNDFAKDLNKIL